VQGRGQTRDDNRLNEVGDELVQNDG